MRMPHNLFVALIATVMLSCTAVALTPHTSTGTFDAYDGEADWDAFEWIWSSRTEAIDVDFSFSVSDGNVLIRVFKEEGGDIALEAGPFAIAGGTNATLTVASTNIPVWASYKAEITQVQETDPVQYKTLARGTIAREWSAWDTTNFIGDTASIQLSYTYGTNNTAEWDEAYDWVNTYSNVTPTYTWVSTYVSTTAVSVASSNLTYYTLTTDVNASNDVQDAAIATKLANVVEDTTPQLGGSLDAQDNDVENLGNVEAHTDEAGSTVTLGNGQGHLIAGKIGNSLPATITIGNSSYAIQVLGYVGDLSTNTFGSSVRGASFHGVNTGGTIVFNNYANGSQVRGAVGSTSSRVEIGTAGLDGIGNLALVYLTAGETNIMTGNASIGLGAVTVSNDNSIVAGDGAESHGDGSITAEGGFFGPGGVPLGSAAYSNGTDFATAAQGALADSALQAADLGDAAYSNQSELVLSAMAGAVTDGQVPDDITITESDPVWTNAQAVGFTMGDDPDVGIVLPNTSQNGVNAGFRGYVVGPPSTGLTNAIILTGTGVGITGEDSVNYVFDTDSKFLMGSWSISAFPSGTYTPTLDAHIATKKYVDDNAGGGGGGFPVAVEPWYNADFSQAAGNSPAYANWDSANGIYGRTLSASNNTKQAWVDSYVTTGGVFVLRTPVGWETGTYGSAWDAVMGVCNGTSLSPFSYVTNSVSFSHTNTAAFTAGNDIEWGRWTNSVGSGFFRFVLDKGNTPAGNDSLGLLGTPSISVE